MNPLPSVLLHQRSPSEGLLGAVSLTSTEAPPPPPRESIVATPLETVAVRLLAKLIVCAEPTSDPPD